ncbi:hypothetical protein MSTO_41990 [Mycobacterium stomatepiae]|uniref:Carboxymuconolactone decarboxylase n=1 Tax=Mycobacterium stomatepiae TaxID=470076 RepID=A0A7I7QCF5_9MYCO|nr:hypothetical protein MSTO_41990 [Mycobacterium stomatepiae]
MALLRAVHRRNCDYLWSHHLPIARRAGLSAVETDAIRDGQLGDDADQSVLAAVDDLVDTGTIATPAWDELGRHFTDAQRMDLVFTIGGYYLLAMAVNAFGIQDEELWHTAIGLANARSALPANTWRTEVCRSIRCGTTSPARR